MRKFKITGSDGEVITGHLPTSWAEVPLAAYAVLAAAALPLPASISEPTAHAYASVAGCEALAKLLGLPTAEPLLTDTLLLQHLYHAAPFLFTGPLPASGAVPGFTHLGTAYEYGGGLPDATGEQLEAVLNFLSAHEGHQLGCGPHLLAVLYRPMGQKQTAAVVEAAAAAFATLPMSLAWPALADFIQRSAPWLLVTQRFLAARAAAELALSAVEQTMALASPGRSWSMQRWLGKVWLRRVAKLLRIFLPPSATTAAPPNKPQINGLRPSLRFHLARR